MSQHVDATKKQLTESTEEVFHLLPRDGNLSRHHVTISRNSSALLLSNVFAEQMA